MLSLPPTVRVFVAVEPIDMRGSFDALAGAVRRLGLDPVDGHLYLFLNKRRRIAKAVWFDGSGWCVLANHLSSHYTAFRFSRGPWPRPSVTPGSRPLGRSSDPNGCSAFGVA